MSEGSDYISPAEAAIKLGVTRQAIYKWVSEGKMPSLKIGEVIRIPRDFEARLIAAQDPASAAG